MWWFNWKLFTVAGDKVQGLRTNNWFRLHIKRPAIHRIVKFGKPKKSKISLSIPANSIEITRTHNNIEYFKNSTVNQKRVR